MPMSLVHFVYCAKVWFCKRERELDWGKGGGNQERFLPLLLLFLLLLLLPPSSFSSVVWKKLEASKVNERYRSNRGHWYLFDGFSELELKISRSFRSTSSDH